MTCINGVDVDSGGYCLKDGLSFRYHYYTGVGDLEVFYEFCLSLGIFMEPRFNTCSYNTDDLLHNIYCYVSLGEKELKVCFRDVLVVGEDGFMEILDLDSFMETYSIDGSKAGYYDSFVYYVHSCPKEMRSGKDGYILMNIDELNEIHKDHKRQMDSIIHDNQRNSVYGCNGMCNYCGMY